VTDGSAAKKRVVVRRHEEIDLLRVLHSPAGDDLLRPIRDLHRAGVHWYQHVRTATKLGGMFPH